jgi:hypothetical protein
MSGVEGLKPCPFCGSEPVYSPTNPEDQGDAWSQLTCTNADCAAQPVIRVYDDDSDFHVREVGRLWNRRAPAEPSVPTEQADGGVVGLEDALDAWIVDGLKAADRRLSTIGPINACTPEDVSTGRVEAYQAGYQNGVKATLTDACYVIKHATPPATPIAGGEKRDE